MIVFREQREYRKCMGNKEHRKTQNIWNIQKRIKRNIWTVGKIQTIGKIGNVGNILKIGELVKIGKTERAGRKFVVVVVRWSRPVQCQAEQNKV